ncbi:MAG: pyridine nucleotide-disulfide oxidoreductase, partial [Nocardioidaceae bacterium]|nr:pyridine nucleotide-disulfide oxidoreductase [Nocardioidaceae bacterium]
MTERISADYLVVGAGAMSLAFVDVILQHDERARIVMVDKRPAPGGHWNDAYPFVRLHQPALFYGLHSSDLGTGGGDLASGPEIVAYFDRAMRRFLATGRVRFLPMCEYRGDGRVVSVVGSANYDVTAHRRVVDGRYLEASVPATNPPAYDVAEVELMPPNQLPRIRKSYDEYVIVGAGKTAVDAVLFLLDNGVPGARITWVTPHASWFWDRAT